jgi:hypothetical protein
VSGRTTNCSSCQCHGHLTAERSGRTVWSVCRLHSLARSCYKKASSKDKLSQSSRHSGPLVAHCVIVAGGHVIPKPAREVYVGSFPYCSLSCACVGASAPCVQMATQFDREMSSLSDTVVHSCGRVNRRYNSWANGRRDARTSWPFSAGRCVTEETAEVTCSVCFRFEVWVLDCI